MSAETLIPDAILAQTELSGVVGDIDDDPDSPDGLWLIASGNNVNTDVRTSFGTPTGNPTVGVDAQEFRALCRQIDEDQTGQPDARIELWEDGSLVRAGDDETVPDGGVVVSFTWNANELGTADGSLVELKVVGTKSGGSPGARNAVEVGAVEWNAEVTSDVVATPPTANLSLTTYIPTVTASDHKTATPPKATLTLTTYIPLVTLGIKVIPPKATLTLTTYVPTVTETQNQLVTPPKATLSLTTYIPIISISGDVIEEKTSFSLQNGGIFFPNAPEALSPDNSSRIPLGISATFTGGGILTAGLDSITTIVETDKDGTLKLQSSADDIAWNTDRTVVLDAANNRKVIENIDIQDTYFRVLYENDVTAQTTLRLQCVCHRETSVSDLTLQRIKEGGAPIPMGRCTVFDSVVFSGPNMGTLSNTIELFASAPVPASGRLTSLVMIVLIPPVSGTTVIVTVRRNGVDVTGSMLTFDDTDVLGDVKTSTFSEPIEAGDFLSMRYAETPTVGSAYSSMIYWRGD